MNTTNTLLKFCRLQFQNRRYMITKKAWLKACSYISVWVCPSRGAECDWWCAGARPQLPVLPSEVATSSPLPPPTQLGQPVIMSTWLAALHPLSSGSNLAPVITLTLSLHGYIISKQLHWHWLHHHQPMNGYFEESLYIDTGDYRKKL